ncbi:MAG: peptidyl-tRNA hydrolase Pth2 [Candidatus Diapherotrites archaeon]
MALKQVLVIRADLKMGRGKIASQCSHAAIESFLQAQKKDKFAADNWLRQGMPKIVLKVSSEKELLELYNAAKRQFPSALIRDAGKTQVEPGSITALGIGPWNENELNSLTGKLKLL